MQPLCSNCYSPNAGKWCGHCSRRYCSRDCQVQDWKEKGHKQWCQKSGQWGKDFEVKPSPDKQGLGIFALRDFKMGENIATEADVIIPSTDFQEKSLPPNILPLLMSGDSFEQKMERYSFSYDFGLRGPVKALCPVICRANHDCVGNARICERKGGAKGVTVLKAIRAISTGEEVTYPYFQEVSYRHYLEKEMGRNVRRALLKDMYGFFCQCAACTDPAVDKKLLSFKPLYQEGNRLMGGRNMEKAAKVLVALCEGSPYFDLGVKFDVYYLQFLALMFEKKPPADAKAAAAKAEEYAALWLDPDSPDRITASRMVADPVGYFRETSSTINEVARRIRRI